MVTKLYIVDHLSPAPAEILFSADTPILPNKDYAIGPCEAGFAYTLSLFDKFDEVIFLKNHDSKSVLIMQHELEIIYKNRYHADLPNLDQGKLNFFGCSHTAGVGHDSAETTYPSILSDMLGLKYNNYGLIGRGNYDIEDLLNTFTIKNSKLVIQFTEMHRIRYSYDNKLIQTAIHWKTVDTTILNPIILGDENLFFNFTKIVERVVNRLREGNNKFILTFTHDISDDYSVRCLEFLCSFKEFRSMQGCATDVGTDGVHFGPKTMKSWANQLCTKWTELYGKE